VNDDTAPSAEDEAFAQGLGSELTSQEIKKLLVPLTDQEREVLRLRFGLDRGASRSIEDVTTELGLELHEVRSIEVTAMNKLCWPERHPEV